VTSTADKAAELRRLHDAPELLVMVNVWDVISATTLASLDACRAIATASHSIAAAAGYPDGERIPRDEMLEAVRRIAAAVDVPVSADLEAGYGDAGETVRRAIGLGVVGANIEDQMRPFDEAVAAVAAVTAAAEAEGVPFALNARTDAFLRAGDRDRDEVMADVIRRGRAFLEAGATCVFVPGRLDEPTVERLVAGIGERKVSTIAVPGSPPLGTLERLGVARVSLGPWSQRIALTAWADAAVAILGGGSLPEGVRPIG
jgi:2-methylisocitrate lyase-like PEP mutase family enzyme